MLRIVAVACLILGLSAPLAADEVCIACDKPVATYRCTLEQMPQQARKLGLQDKVQAQVCETVLAKIGPHALCHAVPDAKTCDGPVRSVTLSDYQRALAGDGESTYQPGVFELARRSVNATWVCITSLFKDC